MEKIDEILQKSVKEIAIPDISAENMLCRIKSIRDEKKKHSMKMAWIPITSSLAASLIFVTVFFSMNKGNEKAGEILEIGFEENDSDSFFLHWDVALSTTSNIQANKKIQIFFGHETDLENVFLKYEYTYDPNQQVSLFLRRNVLDEKKHLISSDVLTEYSDSLKTMLMDKTYDRGCEEEGKRRTFNQFYDDEVDIKDFSGNQTGYLNYSVTLRPKEGESLSISGSNKEKVYSSDGVSPNLRFDIQNEKIEFRKDE